MTSKREEKNVCSVAILFQYRVRSLETSQLATNINPGPSSHRKDAVGRQRKEKQSATWVMESPQHLIFILSFFHDLWSLFLSRGERFMLGTNATRAANDGHKVELRLRGLIRNCLLSSSFCCSALMGPSISPFLQALPIFYKKLFTKN